MMNDQCTIKALVELWKSRVNLNGSEDIACVKDSEKNLREIIGKLYTTRESYLWALIALEIPDSLRRRLAFSEIEIQNIAAQ
ncbi:MAG: hypothetical protein KGL39_04915 [Patescibacteria group bacterium]|nr:hypothetical protein [Patescibacteria group bacterium]